MLDLARGLFEDTTSLEVVINKVMQQSIELIPCQSCSVLLLDKECKPQKAEVCRGRLDVGVRQLGRHAGHVELMKKASEQCDMTVGTQAGGEGKVCCVLSLRVGWIFKFSGIRQNRHYITSFQGVSLPTEYESQ